MEQQESPAKVKPSRRVYPEWLGSIRSQGSLRRGSAALPGHGVLTGQSGSEAPHQEGSVTKGSSFMEWPCSPTLDDGSLALESPGQRSEP